MLMLSLARIRVARDPISNARIGCALAALHAVQNGKKIGIATIAAAQVTKLRGKPMRTRSI